MRTLAIIQARMGSSRLPGKVLAEVANKPLLLHVVERARAIRGLDGVVVATTTDQMDDRVEDLMRREAVEVFRGSETDVLDRYYQTATQYGANVVMRITADCPLLDPETSRRVLRYFHDSHVDYASNFFECRTFPDGLDTEVFSFSAVRRAWHEAKLSSEREHVTPYLWNHPEIFRLGGVFNGTDLSHHRWTVDEQRDLEFIRALWGYLPTQGNLPTLEEIVKVLRCHPELSRINAGAAVNAGYAKSLLEHRATP